MKRANDIFRWSIRVATGLLLLVVLSPALLYVPFVQNYIKDYAVGALSEATGFEVSLRRILLRFPLSLSLDGLAIVAAPADTLIAADNITIEVKPLPLLRKEVAIEGAALTGGVYSMASEDESLKMRVGVDECRFGLTRIDLKSHTIITADATLAGGRIRLLSYPEKAVADTAATSPAEPWLIRASVLRLHDVDYSMQMLPMIDTLDAHVADARLDGIIVDMEHSRVDAHSLAIDGADCRYIYPENAPEANDTDTIPAIESAIPWRVTGETVRLANSHAVYALAGHKPSCGLDMGYIEADSINIAIDNFYNCGTAVRVPVKNISARERCGFVVDSVKCLVEIDSTRLAVTGLLIANARSRIKGNVESNMDFNKFDADITATLSADDIRLLYPAVASVLPGRYPRSADLDFAAHGTMKRVDITKCLFTLPGMARITAGGFISNLDDPKRLGCDITFKGSTGNLNAMKKSLMADADMRRSISLPPLRINGRATASGDSYAGNVALALASGDIVLDAGWNGGDSSYRMEFDAAALPVDAILPASKLHQLTASGIVEGRGLDVLKPNAFIKADITIDSICYNSNRYYDITLKGMLSDGDFDVDLSSGNPHCNFHTTANGKIDTDHYLFAVKSEIADLDLTALRLMDITSAGSCTLSASGEIDMVSGSYDVTAGIENLRWTLDDNFYYTDLIDANFVADESHIDATLSNNDFLLDFDSECPLDTLAAKVTDIADVIARQWNEKYINSDSIRGRLPAMTCEIELGKRNVVQQYLLHTGVEYERGNFMLANDSTFYLRGRLDRLKVNEIELDTVRFGAVELNHRINMLAHVGNAKEHIAGFANADLKGFVNGSKVEAQLTQRNFENSTGINVGISAELTDSTVRANLFPKEITIGYKPWTVNDGNYLTFNYATKHFDADLRLTQGSSLVSLYTVHDDHHNGGDSEDVKLKINNVQIADWLSISPFAPPVKGVLGADFSIKYNTTNIWGDGMVGITDLIYGKKRVGSLRVNSLIDLNPATGGTSATANLEVDGRQCAVVFGSLNDSIPDNRMTLSLEMYKFPLTIFNPFINSDMMNLSGYLNGEMTVGGNFEHPIITGYIDCDSTSVQMPVFGSSITLPDDSIPIDSSRIRFDDYRIHCLNKNPIVANGVVDLTSIESPRIDLSMKGSNVQFVDSKQKRNSQIFGKGFLNIDATARGTLDNVDLTARLALLAGSNITYVLQEDVNTIAARQEQNLVKFVQFNDTSYVVTEEKDAAIGSSINMVADIQVQQGTTLSVFLSQNGKDRAEIFGNGDLRLSINRLGDQTMTGRFNIDEGFVRYSPPLISQVDFKFNGGSYIMWTGDLMNPTLNLSAVETRKTNYTGSDSNTRLVNFLVTLSVTNALANMDVTFDLDTSDDLNLHNELQSMSPAQRSSQAVNLLLYNTYTGLDSKATGNLSGNPLFLFVTSRINNWAASAMKGISVSFGLDDYTETRDGVSSRAIKYSYQVSKSLFDNRFKIVVGGDYTQGTTSSQDIAQNLFNDVSLEYMLNKRGSMLLRLFNHKGYLNVLEGEVTETGVGLVYKRKMSDLRYMFRFLKRLTKKRNKDAGVEPQVENAASDSPGGNGATTDNPKNE